MTHYVARAETENEPRYSGPSRKLAVRAARRAAEAGHIVWLRGSGLGIRCYLPKLCYDQRWHYLVLCPDCGKNLMSPLPHVKRCRPCYEYGIYLTSPYNTVKVFMTERDRIALSNGELKRVITSVLAEVKQALREGREVRYLPDSRIEGGWRSSLRVYGIRRAGESYLAVCGRSGWCEVREPAWVRWRVGQKDFRVSASLFAPADFRL